MLDLRAVRFAYPGLAMQFDLHVEPRSFTAIIGPSGSGKSTLLSLIAGFETPSSGTIAIAGQSMAGTPPAQRPLSMIFQDNNVFAHLDVFTNVALGLSPSLKLTQSQRDEVLHALENVGLSGKELRLPGDLSGGERQRVAIARAILRKRPVLLLDEPFSGLDPALRADMLALIKSTHDAQGLTTLMVTHDPEDARAVASHTAFVSGGKIVAHRRTSDLLSATGIPGLDAYLGRTR